LRMAVFLLGAYVVFRRTFPFVAIDKRFIDVTIGEFLLVVFEVLLAITAS